MARESNSEFSASGSEMSLSDQIIIQSNEKRLQERLTSLQTSITSLKEQLKHEKKMWKEDMEKIRTYQKYQDMRCLCSVSVHHPGSIDITKFENPSRTNSIYSLVGSDWTIQQRLELQNYKRRLAETENLCNMELLKVKQSLQDLKVLRNIAFEWGKDDKTNNSNMDSVSEIFVRNYDLISK